MRTEESIMTDFQMRAIFELIINLLENNKDNSDKVIKMLKDIIKKPKEEE
jgi:hypothetical protein